MKLTWFGRYRDITAAMIRFSNCSDRMNRTLTQITDGVIIDCLTWQLLETVIEFEEDNPIMADLALRLGSTPGTLSKKAQRLVKLGLVERYHIEGNKKNVILKPTSRGLDIYSNHCTQHVQPAFQSFFDSLSMLDDTQLEKFTEIINKFNDSLCEQTDAAKQLNLIKID